MATMWAVQIREQCGEPNDVLFVNENVTKPIAGEKQVLVKMNASPVNPSDLLYVRGQFLSTPQEFPATAGAEGTGVIEAVGEGCSLKPGTRVVFWHGYQPGCTGSWAEYCVLSEDYCFTFPFTNDQIDDEKAAAACLNPFTMMGAMEELGMDLMNQGVSHSGPKEGDWVLQNAANSSTGKFLIQFLKSKKLKTINIVRSSSQIDALKKIGADVVIATDVSKMEDEVKKIAGNEGVKYGFDCIYGSKVNEMLSCLSTRGKLMCYGLLESPIAELPIWPLILGLRSVQGFLITPWLQMQPKEKLEKLMEMYGNLVCSGQITNATRLSSCKDAVEAIVDSEKPGISVKMVISARN